MPLQKPRKGTAKEKRNCWSRGNGPYSYGGELKHGLSLNRRYLNRKVRRYTGDTLKENQYRKIFCLICRSGERMRAVSCKPEECFGMVLW